MERASRWWRDEEGGPNRLKAEEGLAMGGLGREGEGGKEGGGYFDDMVGGVAGWLVRWPF